MLTLFLSLVKFRKEEMRLPKLEQPHEALTSEAEYELALRFSGKILLHREITLPKDFFKYLLTQGYFSQTESIKQKTFSAECVRCHNQKPSLFGKLPCRNCQKDCLYCRKCIEMGRVLACEPLYYWSKRRLPWPRLSNVCAWEGQLTEQQQRGAERIKGAINHLEQELLVWGVCGAGKTEMLYPGIEEAVRLGKRVCLASPRADVVRELLPRLRTSFPTVPIEGLYGGSEDKAGRTQIILATTHQLLRYKSAFDVLIIDEVDAFPYHNDATLPFASDRAKKKSSTTIYLTATPRKNHQRKINRNKLPHIFIPVRFHGHPLPVPHLKMIFSLEKDLKKFTPPAIFVNDLINRANPNRQILIFIPTIQLAKRLEVNLTQALLAERVIAHAAELQSVHAEDPFREEKVESFRKKELNVLLTTTILERGVTFPAIDVFVLDAGHHVFDEAALVQIAGRAGRSPKDPTGNVVFYHDGKTNAMVRSIKSITSMNKRGGFI